MIRKIGIAALSGVLALGLTACGSTSESKFVFAMDTDLVSLDSSAIDDGGSINAIKASVIGLMDHGKDGSTINGIANKVDKSNDGLTYTFHLRNAKWSNGADVTADDFVYAWQRIFKNTGNYIYMFGSAAANIKNADKLMAIAGTKKLTQKKLNTLGVKAVNDHTLKVTLERKVPFFTQLMTFTCFRPINRAFAEKQGKNYGKSAKAFISNGPFKVTSWTLNSKLNFEKNDSFYDADNVHLDKLTFNLAQDTQAAASAYTNGNVDLFTLNSAMIDKYKKNAGYKTYSTGFEYYLLVNFKNKYLANKNIRTALSYAINRNDLATNILKDGSTASKGFVPEGLAQSPSKTDFRKDAGTYATLTYNRKKAQSYFNKGLKELGVSSIKLRLLYGTDESPMDTFATYLQNAFTKIKGLKIEMVSTVKNDRVNNKQANGEFDLSCTRWGPDYADPTTYLNLLTKGNSNNYGKYNSAAYNKYMNQALATDNMTSRWNDLVKAEQTAMKDLAVIPVFDQGGAYVMNTDYTGLVQKAMVGTIFRYVTKK